MLVDFRVQNFKSIGESQTLSLVAGNGTELGRNVIDDPKVVKRKNLRLLRSVVIYGANASGKTNLLYALSVMTRLVSESATRFTEGDELPGIDSFRLRSDLRAGPSEFEVRVLRDGIIYRYGFAATRQRICKEWLYVTSAAPRSKEIPLFVRNGEANKWTFGASFRGSRSFLKSNTRSNCLLLSMAARENYSQVRNLVHWFASGSMALDLPAVSTQLEMRLASQCCDGKIGTDSIALISRVADPGVAGAEQGKEHIVLPEEIHAFMQSEAKRRGVEMPKEFDQPELKLIRTSTDDDRAMAFDMEDESLGTRKFIVVTALMAEAFATGQTLIMDELGTSLHASLVSELLDVMNDPELGSAGAQFIIATHDTNLLDIAKLRRDQIIIAEKGPDHQTEIFSLFDIEPKPRPDASLERQYLAGRFGGVPRIGNLRLTIADVMENIKHIREDGDHQDQQETTSPEDLLPSR